MNPQDKLVSAEQAEAVIRTRRDIFQVGSQMWEVFDSLLRNIANLPASNAWRDIAPLVPPAMFGDEMGFLDIPVARVMPDGAIGRTLNGVPITPGTDLYIRAPSPANVEGDGR